MVRIRRLARPANVTNASLAGLKVEVTAVLGYVLAHVG